FSLGSIAKPGTPTPRARGRTVAGQYEGPHVNLIFIMNFLELPSFSSKMRSFAEGMFIYQLVTLFIYLFVFQESESYCFFKESGGKCIFLWT
ncbi:unnamed protein product, partial [Gulo gulo]